MDSCLKAEGLPQGLASSFDGMIFGEEGLIEALKELEPHSAAPDGDVPARILTACKEEVVKPLTLF